MTSSISEYVTRGFITFEWDNELVIRLMKGTVIVESCCCWCLIVPRCCLVNTESDERWQTYFCIRSAK